MYLSTLFIRNDSEKCDLQKFTWPIHEKIINNNYTIRICHACKFE